MVGRYLLQRVWSREGSFHTHQSDRFEVLALGSQSEPEKLIGPSHLLV